MVEMIITEKPSAAKKIADALADSSPTKLNINSVPYYKIKHNGEDIIITSAVGHLYTVAEKVKSPWSKFPVYDVEWVPTADVDKSADYSKKYLNVIKKLSKESDSFTVACDYDIEGEVIGLNVIRYACNQKDASRMKFSTLTKPDLIKAYEQRSKTLDWGQANAGDTRHMLDFYYGINLTRALTDAINRTTGGFKVLSSGRVQGPALKMVVDKEKDIKAFIPEPYWQIELKGLLKAAEIVALHEKDKIWKKEEADSVMEKVTGEKKGKIKSAEKNKFNQAQPVPFDLTSMQIEVYRVFKIKPKETLDIAQRLYTDGLISYPRTSSQKLPVQLGFRNILTQLQRQEFYKELAGKLLAKDKLIPNEGKKVDDAHPAIYPTGIAPEESLNERDYKVYDLIVKRFFSVFSEPAIRETNTIQIDVKDEIFITKGTVTIHKGWHEFYAPYVKLDEIELPSVIIGDIVDINSIEQLSKETKPPNRFTQSSIIRELEKKNLGTKATRATIVETLFHRGYVIGDKNIEATELGIKTSDTLEKYCPEIVDVVLTRHFEEEMEMIRKQQKTPDDVLKKAMEVINKIVINFKKHEGSIGGELAESNQEAIKIATTIGKCPNCEKGELTLRKGKFGKFIACNNYPECKTTYNVPRTGDVKPTDKLCEICQMPIVEVRLPKKAPQFLCINPECESKKPTDAKGNIVDDTKFAEEGMVCPACGKGKMVLRKSFYGEFLGCDNYPKCKTMMKIVEGKVDTNHITQNSKPKYAAKKASKKAVGKTAKGAAKSSAKKAVKTTAKKAVKKAVKSAKKLDVKYGK